MGNLEVLAPVGTFDNLRIAINSGANAVYFGVKGFNAREKADNISIDDLEKFVNLAHLHDIKTYLTLNILIKDSEFDEVFAVVDKAINANVDAFIVQDIGLATMLLSCYENIVLHASTQMGIHNLAGAKFLEQLGFKRVVLAREAKIDDIIDIHKNTNLEIEYFVQGALCVAFSGNCYFSSLCFGASGNRGKCVQPCRMKYDAILSGRSVSSGYFLSPKDLCLIKKLDELKNAGVTSFKIEGRLRRPSYLAQATMSYVNAINGSNKNEINNLKKVFARGDYNYGNYLTGNDNIIESNIQNHRGEYIGEVKSVKPFKNLFRIAIKSDEILHSGDGLKIINGDNEVGLGVGNVEKRGNLQYIFSTRKVPLGKVFRAVDFEFEKHLFKENKKIKLEIRILAKEGEKLTAEVTAKGQKFKFCSETIAQKAKNMPLNFNDFRQVFDRTKDTEFEVEKLYVTMDNIFISKSELTKFKNESISYIENILLDIVKNNCNNVNKIGVCDKRYDHVGVLGCDDVDFVYTDKTLINIEKCAIFAPKIYTYDIVSNFSDKYFYLNLPIIATGEEMKIIDEIVCKMGNARIGVVANNYWALKYIGQVNVIIGTGLNVVNNYSASYYKKLGATNFIRSIEDDLTTGLEGGITYTGYPVLMTWCHCPFKVCLNSSCDNCKFSDNLEYKLADGKVFKISRYKIRNCYFELVSTRNKTSNRHPQVVDLRNV